MKDQSGSKRKREARSTRTAKKRQRNKEPVITTRAQKPDISHVKSLDSSARHLLHINPQGPHENNYQAHIPAFVASGGLYLCSEYEMGATSIAAGVSKNKMAVPMLHHQAFNDTNYLPTQVHTDMQLNAAPPVLQRQVHKTSQLPCSMPGCKNLCANKCVGSYCWKCCRSTRRKCLRHKFPWPPISSRKLILICHPVTLCSLAHPLATIFGIKSYDNLKNTVNSHAKALTILKKIVSRSLSLW